MDYLLTPEQKELQTLVHEFAVNEVEPKAKAYDLSGEFPADLFKIAADMGLTLLHIPERFGGLGQSLLTQAIVMEELAMADAGFASTVGACDLAATPVMLAGTDEQKHQVADVLAAGGLAAFCLTEAEAGSDAASLKTTATADGDDYIINGTKTFITNGGVAGIYVVMATVDRSLGAKGITAFLVERDREGVSVGKEENKMGIRLSNTTDVIFQNVRIPKKNMVGQIGQGLKLALGTLDRTRGAGAAYAIGVCQKALDLSVEYAKQRKTFGKPIIANQAIQFKLADMEIKTQTARQMVRYAVNLVDNGIIDSSVSAVAKTYAGDVAVEVALEAIQIFGGYGYSREFPVEKLLRDAKIFQIFEGTGEIQRMVIAGALARR